MIDTILAANAKLYAKMEESFQDFSNWLLKQQPEEILNHAYEYATRAIIKLLTLPIVLTVDVFTWICIGLISCSSLIFGFASFLLTLLGITVLATYSWQNGLILLFLAYLASPMGLPMFAVKLLSGLQYITGAIKAL